MLILELDWWLDKRCHEVLRLLATGLRNYPEGDDDLTIEVINDELFQYGSPYRSKHESADIFQLTKPKAKNLEVVGNTLQNSKIL